jgi:AraC-like DNA-binding protein/quercetin dioxygenase-like cupin family protein
MSTLRFVWRHFAPAGEAFHLARSIRHSGNPMQLHCHDFAEICWVEAGEGWHVLNGLRLPLAPGEIFFVLPTDCHGLLAKSGRTLQLVNIAFPASVVSDLHKRYFPNTPRWFWGDRMTAGVERLTSENTAALGRIADELAVAPQEPFHRDRFLLNLFERVQVRPNEAWPADMPTWLREACLTLRRPENFRQGVPELVRAARKSPEHLARSLRLHLGLTPTEYVNQARIEYAAMRLRMSSASVTEVAYDSGFENLSHFFHLFRAAFKMSPRTYRRFYWRGVA